MTSSALNHFRPGCESSASRTIELGGVERRASDVWAAASNQNPPLKQQGSGVIEAVEAQLAGQHEPAGLRIVEFRPAGAAACDQDLAVWQRRRGLSVAAFGHFTGRDEFICRRVIELSAFLAATRDQDFAILEQRRGWFVASRLHVGPRREPARGRIEDLCGRENPGHRGAGEGGQRDERRVHTTDNQNSAVAQPDRGMAVTARGHRPYRQENAISRVVNFGGIQDCEAFARRCVDGSCSARDQNHRPQGRR